MKNTKDWLKESWYLARTVEFYTAVIDAGEETGADFIAHRDIAKARLEKRKAAINALENPLHKRILWMRYIQHHSWEHICRQTNYSRSRCNLRHNRAIAEVKAGGMVE